MQCCLFKQGSGWLVAGRYGLPEQVLRCFPVATSAPLQPQDGSVVGGDWIAQRRSGIKRLPGALGAKAERFMTDAGA